MASYSAAGIFLSDSKRFLCFVHGIGRADEVVVGCLRRRHQGHDFVAELAIISGKLAAVPNLFKCAREGAVLVAVHGSLVVHAAGNKQYARVDFDFLGASVVVLNASIERAVRFFHLDAHGTWHSAWARSNA